LHNQTGSINALLKQQLSLESMNCATGQSSKLACWLHCLGFGDTSINEGETCMLDAFTKVISQADARGDYLNGGQIDALLQMVKDGPKRMDVVNRITGNATAIVTNAARALFDEQPQLIAPGGNAYTHRRMAACLRDMDIVLRYVTYAMFTGDGSVLDDRCLNGLRETYLALGVPGGSVAESIRKMKEAAIAVANDRAGVTQGDCSSLMAELGSYFDRAAAAVG
jgi:phycocyanin beta chain